MIKKLLNGQIIIFLILFSPLIDIVTSIMTYNGINLTLGLFIKVIVLMFATIYLLFIDQNNKKYNYLLLGILSIHNILHIINNLSIIKEHYFSYFGYLIKFDFIIIMLLFFIKYFKENKFDLKFLKIPIVIVCLSLVISNITGTSLDTYDAVRSGTSSWFQSANEFGALLSILYPISIYLFIDRKYSKKIEVIYVIILAYGLLEIGTKVGLISFFISSITYIIVRLINIKKYKLNYAFYSIIALILISISCINYLPAVKNVKLKYELTGDISEVMISGRDRYLSYIRSIEYNPFDYLTGKSNTMDNEILLIELDMYDMFYMFGILGFIIIYGMILFVVIQIALKYKQNILSGLKYTKINMLLVCLALSFLISITAGHVILCPSVSIYIALICGYLTVYHKFEKEENNKKQILIGAVHMKVGGIEKTLINLLNKLDYDKYEVDLLLQLENGEYYKDIPKEVKIITPYHKFFSNFFRKESKLSKIIKHLLYNKYTSWLWTNNKQYDVAIDYPGYYLFIDYYISNSNSIKKYIWIHLSPNGYINLSENNKKIFMNNINKYKKYDNIICVSDSAKEEFNEILPQYKDKTKVILNIQDNNLKLKENVKLSKNFNIISAGRLCAPKAFHRLIEVHKNLIDLGYKVNTYILGSGEKYNELKELINKYHLENSFYLLGQKNNVYDYFKKADLFVTTSYSEALPTVLLESLMCNLPWVGPNVTGVKDIYKLSPPNSSILTEDNIESITQGVKDAIDGKINKKFKFNIDKYNEKALKQFYDLIGG